MKINKLKLISALSGIFILFNSCSEDDGATDIFEEINATLPSSMVLKNIPAGTFTMGGPTVQNNAPEVSITLTAFKISEKEITNQEYINFLNEAYTHGWIMVSAKQTSDPCGTYTEKMVIGAGGAPDPVNASAGTNNKRVRRGGSWNYHASTLLTDARASDFENRGNNHFGFRIVKK